MNYMNNYLLSLITRLKEYSSYFTEYRGINDIFTNSKIYEVVIAEQLNHSIINGHAHTPDAEDSLHNIFEYKHYKTSSSNHTWTFNDFSNETIQNLSNINYVVFAELYDLEILPYISKLYIVPSADVQNYLMVKTPSINNTRAMINISAHQIETEMGTSTLASPPLLFSEQLVGIFETANEIEQITSIPDVLTSNKLWELLVALELGHIVNPEQNKHDAVDKSGHTYEYKVCTRMNWSFQDISDQVLSSYLNDEAIILAVVNKADFVVTNIFRCSPESIVSILRKKTQDKLCSGKEVRRLMATINKSDLLEMVSQGEAQEI